MEEVLEEEKLKEWKKVLDQSEVEAKNESKNDPFKNDKISNRLCFEMNDELIPRDVEQEDSEAYEYLYGLPSQMPSNASLLPL